MLERQLLPRPSAVTMLNLVGCASIRRSATLVTVLPTMTLVFGPFLGTMRYGLLLSLIVLKRLCVMWQF